jgi:hypothetical protein
MANAREPKWQRGQGAMAAEFLPAKLLEVSISSFYIP